MNFGGFLVGFLAVALAERFYEHRFSQRAERGELKMNWSFAALQWVFLVVFVGTGVEYFLNPRPVVPALLAVGLGLWAVALVVRLAAIRTLGRFWSLDLEIRREHQMITEGIYRRLRHPAYSSIMLEVVAVPLVGQAYGTLGLAVGVYVPLLLWRWHREERELVVKFGERYVEYQRQVPAFVPWPGKHLR